MENSTTKIKINKFNTNGSKFWQKTTGPLEYVASIKVSVSQMFGMSQK